MNPHSFGPEKHNFVRDEALHTYSTLLKANAEDVKVVQELMRHANIATTMNVYTKALTFAKR
jgi:integrase